LYITKKQQRRQTLPKRFYPLYFKGFITLLFFDIDKQKLFLDVKRSMIIVYIKKKESISLNMQAERRDCHEKAIWEIENLSLLDWLLFYCVAYPTRFQRNAVST